MRFCRQIVAISPYNTFVRASFSRSRFGWTFPFVRHENLRVRGYESSPAICLRSYGSLFLPSRSDRRSDLSSTRRDRDPARTQDVGRKEEMKHPPTTVMAGDQPKSKARKKKRRKFAWKIVDFAPCSKECGGGKPIINRARCNIIRYPPLPFPRAVSGIGRILPTISYYIYIFFSLKNCQRLYLAEINKVASH